MIRDIISKLVKYKKGIPLKRLSPRIRTGERRSIFLDKGLDFDRTREFDPKRDKLHQVIKSTMGGANKMMVWEAKEETEIDTVLAFDLSSSMWTGLAGPHKGISNKEWLMLWSLGTLGLTSSVIQDRVGFLGFDKKIIFDYPPKRGEGHIYYALGQISDFFESLDSPTGRRSSINNALDHIKKRQKKSSLVILISDFIDNEDIHKSSLLRYIATRHEVISIIIDDIDSLPTSKGLGLKSVRMYDVETEQYQFISLRNIKKAKDKILEKRRRLIKGFDNLGIDSAVISKSNYRVAISRLIEKRKK